MIYLDRHLKKNFKFHTNSKSSTKQGFIYGGLACDKSVDMKT